ncbi:GNAT family N-acetyltransferase [Streptomyces sp. WI04-05B]|uniref:GNAT family N-acetyltransferase n=1 Tax=Streptomyces TaxID=1883 RepID=UPI0029A708B0|nr:MULTISPECIES: GNAT family N-acetyltransferase [unclassified Streptomyces]MDX2547888.1 GNAT family N-acetyltransferase [Streptomyces sp. WI04-05B]MDX2584423.1 GNAT family N-acetyltransferase [Streptomyces sp. WI04-05A]MDX3753293.1 GNAT family N-acetyltransferase [Streptomyces sp. AK08-02]
MRWWDIEPVLELEKDLFPEDAWSRGMFWSDLAHARGPDATRRYFVAEDAESAPEGGRRIIGYAGLATAGTESDSGSATGADIQTIAVAREHWGTGLGALLLTELLRAATAFECAEVMLECRVDNVRAQKLYERFGFEPIGFRRGYYQPGNVDALVMRLRDPAASVPAREADEQRTEVRQAGEQQTDVRETDVQETDVQGTESNG